MIRGRNVLGASAGVAPVAVDRVAAPIGFTLNGEMSQNTALAGLLLRDTRMRELAGDTQWVLLTPSSLRLTARSCFRSPTGCLAASRRPRTLYRRRICAIRQR